MNNLEIAALTDKYVARTYARIPIALVRGKGTKVWDADGKEYLDFLAGIAVNNLGHCHPAVVRAIRDQSKKLLHVSKLKPHLKHRMLSLCLLMTRVSECPVHLAAPSIHQH